VTSFRCPICNTLYMRLPKNEQPCRICHASFIDPSEFKGGDKAEKLWKEKGLTHAFRT